MNCECYGAGVCRACKAEDALFAAEPRTAARAKMQSLENEARMTAREQITQIRRAAITKFNADYRAKIEAELACLDYPPRQAAEMIDLKMKPIEEGNELSSMFWIHALIEYLDKPAEQRLL